MRHGAAPLRRVCLMLGIYGDSRLAVLSELFSADTSAIVKHDQFRDGGGALTALDFDHDMAPLRVAARLCKTVDPILSDLEPFTRADLGTGPGFEFTEVAEDPLVVPRRLRDPVRSSFPERWLE